VYGDNVDTNSIDYKDISPELLFCHRPCAGSVKRIYHPERECRNYEIVLVQDKPDIHIVNEKEYFAYPEDIIFIKPGDTYSYYSYGTNYTVVFTVQKNDGHIYTVCDYFFNFRQHYIIKDSEKDVYADIIKNIFTCFESVSAPVLIKAKALLVYLLHLLCRDSSIHNINLNKSIEFINSNIGSKVLVDQLANETGLSRPHFHKLFKDTYGITPIDYVNKLKMKAAREMLADKNAKIHMIAKSLGFESEAYFRELFKQTYGFSPQQYIKTFVGS
jgi:AraC-like DNA-binding protein